MMITSREHQRFAWALVILLFLGSVVNYLDRTVLGVVMPQIRNELDLSHTEYSLAVNAFLVMYAILYVGGGRLADRFGYRRAVTVTVVLWSVANMLHAFVRGLGGLCLFRGLLGMAEGGYYPAAMKGATEWFPPEDRAKPVGVLLCGVSVGTLIAAPVVALITLKYGWRMSFFLTGAMGLLLIPPWLILHRMIRKRYGSMEPMSGPAAGAGGDFEAVNDEPSLGEVLRRRKFWLVLMARAMTDSAWYFYLFWIPGYFQEVRHFDLKMVGLLLWIPYFMSNLGGLTGAWTSSALIKRGYSVDRARKSVLLPGASLAATGALAYFVTDPYLALAIVSLALFGHLAWSTNIHTVITEITPKRHVGVLYGMTGASGTVMGAISQPVIGRVVDLVGYSPAFIYAGCAYFVAISLLLGAGRIERIRSTRQPLHASSKT